MSIKDKLTQLQTSKLFWLLLPIQFGLNWVLFSILLPFHLVVRILNLRYEKKTFGYTPQQPFDSGENLILRQALQYERLPRVYTAKELKEAATAQWPSQYNYMVHDGFWLEGGHNPDGSWSGTNYGTGHASGIHGLTWATCANIGTDEHLEAMTVAGAKYIQEDGRFVRNVYDPTTAQISQDMMSSFCIGAISAFNRLPENSSARQELIRKFKLFGKCYIKNGYSIPDGPEFGNWISPRFRNTPGINYNYYPGRPNYEHWSLVTGVHAAIALAILHSLYHITKEKKYLMHYLLLKYAFGFGLWAFIPNLYLWQGAVPSWFPKIDNSNAPGRAGYFNDTIAFEAVFAQCLLSSNFWNRMWLKNIHKLSSNYYMNTNMVTMIHHVEPNSKGLTPLELAHLSSFVGCRNTGENWWTNSVMAGLAFELQPQYDFADWGNNSFMLPASLLKVDE